MLRAQINLKFKRAAKATRGGANFPLYRARSARVRPHLTVCFNEFFAELPDLWKAAPEVGLPGHLP